MSNYRFRRALVIDRRERKAKNEELKLLMKQWPFWRDFLARSFRFLLPFLFVSLTACGFGAVLGVQFVAKRVSTDFHCSPKVN